MISCCTIHLADIPIGFTKAPFNRCGLFPCEEGPSLYLHRSTTDRVKAARMDEVLSSGDYF